MSDDALTISVNYGPVDATFKGKFSKMGRASRAAGGPIRARMRQLTCRMILGEHG